MFLQWLYQQKTFKNYQNFLAKGLEDPFIGMNIRQKVRIKIQQMNIDRYFLKSNFVGVNRFFIQMYMKIRKDLKSNDITYQKEFLIIITSSSDN